MKMTLELRDDEGDLVAVWKLDENVDLEHLARNIAAAVSLHESGELTGE